MDIKSTEETALESHYPDFTGKIVYGTGKKNGKTIEKCGSVVGYNVKTGKFTAQMNNGKTFKLTHAEVSGLIVN